MPGHQHTIRRHHQIRLDHIRALFDGEAIGFQRMFGQRAAGSAMGNHQGRLAAQGLPLKRRFGFNLRRAG